MMTPYLNVDFYLYIPVYRKFQSDKLKLLKNKIF